MHSKHTQLLHFHAQLAWPACHVHPQLNLPSACPLACLLALSVPVWPLAQFSYYSLGPPPPLLLAAPYDQFLLRDFDPLTHDEAGFAAYVDPSTGVVVAPVWQSVLGQQLQQPMTDGHLQPYPDCFQAAYRAGRVFEYVRAGESARLAMLGPCQVPGNMCLGMSRAF